MAIVRLTTADAQANLPNILQQVVKDEQSIILTSEGKEMAAIISMEAFEFLERMIEKIEDEIDLKALHEVREDNEEEKNITLEELKQEFRNSETRNK